MCTYDRYKLASPPDDVACLKCGEDWDHCELTGDCDTEGELTVDDKGERLSLLRCMGRN